MTQLKFSCDSTQLYRPTMNCRTNGVSDHWCVGPMVCRPIGVSDQWCVGPMTCGNMNINLRLKNSLATRKLFLLCGLYFPNADKMQCDHHYYVDMKLNPLIAKLFNLNFHPPEVVSRWRDPQLQVSENYSDLQRSTVFKYCWLMSQFIFNMFNRWYLMC